MTHELDGDLDATVTDDSVQFAFAVHNADDDDVELQFSDAQTFDVAVTDDDGEEVWRLSHGAMFAQMLRQETVPAGATETYEAAWESPEPGEYRAHATLSATNADCEAETEFSY